MSLHSATHQKTLAQLDSWVIKGKFGFKSPDKKQSANFRWQQIQQHYRLNLTSIIGTSLLSLQSNEEDVTLVVDDKTYQDTNPSQLIWRVTGWQIPVEKLQLWIKGQYQNKDQVVTSEHGWITQLQPSCRLCDNWLVNYDNYKLVEKMWLPHKVVLHNSANNSQLLIRISHWEFHE